MRRLLAFLLVVGLLHAAPALAQTSNMAPFLGRWAVEVERLPMPPEARPKSVTFTFGEAADGKWSTEVEIVDAGGTAVKAFSTWAANGVPAEVTGSPEADLAAATVPQPGVLVIALSKGGVPGSTRIYAVAADGKTMVETAVYFRDGGIPVMRTNYFTRIR